MIHPLAASSGSRSSSSSRRRSEMVKEVAGSGDLRRISDIRVDNKAFKALGGLRTDAGIN